MHPSQKLNLSGFPKDLTIKLTVKAYDTEQSNCSFLKKKKKSTNRRKFVKPNYSMSIMVKKKKKEQMQQWDSPQHLAGQHQNLE